MSRLAKGYDPGRLFDRVDIEGATQVDDGGGGFTQTWAAITDGSGLPAAVEPLEGDERLRAMQTDANVTHEVRLRYVDGVKASQRVKVTSDGDRILKIVSAPITVGRKQWLTLMCREDLT